MSAIPLSPLDLALATLLLLAMGLLSWRMQLGVGRSLAIAAVRATLQLGLIGLVLKALFASVSLGWVALAALVMLAAAAREVPVRQGRPLAGGWALLTGGTAMFLSSFLVTVLALLVMVQPEPWYHPQYAIPLLGMMLGNTMNGVALAADRLTDGAWRERAMIEQRLALGHSRQQALSELTRAAARSGTIPIINATAAAGLVSLPGMMTGQILAGAPPTEAVKYQLLILFLITAGTGLGVAAGLWLTARRLFDERQRLRLERLAAGRQ